MNVREQTQKFESMMLSPFACLSADTAGRARPEQECPIRTPFQRDRDRIVHCKSYRRLMHKTQVFFYPVGDHYRTRLTHTIEVSQIARTIARALRLNEDLTEAIAQGHDLGHTPFAHAGETALRNIMGSFNHNEQSLRVVERLEKGGQGLNLCAEVRDGILCHRSHLKAKTLEGVVVRYADKIAYLNHDIEDAMRAGCCRMSRPFRFRCGKCWERIAPPVLRCWYPIWWSSRREKRRSACPSRCSRRTMSFAILCLRRFIAPKQRTKNRRSCYILEGLYRYYEKNPDSLPEEYRIIADEEGKERAVCDYISGMSDRFAVRSFEELFVPKSWSVG